MGQGNLRRGGKFLQQLQRGHVFQGGHNEIALPEDPFPGLAGGAKLHLHKMMGKAGRGDVPLPVQHHRLPAGPLRQVGGLHPLQAASHYRHPHGFFPLSAIRRSSFEPAAASGHIPQP